MLSSYAALRRALILSATAAAALLALPAQGNADGLRAVVELFTSQGCSSGPPADRLAGEMAKDARTLVLTFNVDYWDYIGWKDTLASPAFTTRQKAYASARGDGHVYTPQAVLGGFSHGVGSDEAEIEAGIKAAAAHGALSVPVKLTAQGGGVKVDVGDGAASASASLWLLRLTRQKAVSIGRGENSGKSVTYTNVVRSMVKLGDWSGKAASFDAPAAQTQGADSDSFAVILQSGPAGRPGVILGAAKG